MDGFRLHKNCEGSSRVHFVAALLSVAMCVRLNAGNDESTSSGQNILAAAAKARESDVTTLSRVACSGKIEWIGANGTDYWMGDCSFRVDGKSLWMDLSTTAREPESVRRIDRQQITADGTTLATVISDARIRPTGCEAYTYPDDELSFGVATKGMKLDPRLHLSPGFLNSLRLKNFETDGADISVIQSSDDTAVIRVDSKNDRWEITVRKVDHRLQRAAYFVDTVTDGPWWTFDYEWATAGDLVFPKHIVWQMMNLPLGNGTITQKLSIDKIEKAVDDNSIALAGMEFCDGARLIDYREDAVEPVRTVAASGLTRAAGSATIAEQVDALPARAGHQPKLEPPTKRVSTSRIQWLVWANIGLLVVCAAWWLRRR